MVIDLEIYITKIKELAKKFSYYDFISILKELDKEIINGNIHHINSEFVYYFDQIISMVNDKYIVDGEEGTLGHMLIENALLNKERLTPTLAMSFFLEQKTNLGLDDICNEFYFSYLNEKYYRMMITEHHDTGRSDISINWKCYSDPNKNTDEHNYGMMSDILHELTHVYQLSRTEETENTFDKLAYYDYQKDNILIENGANNSHLLFHQALLSEFMADEQAYVFMLQLAQKHPEYFNDDLLEKKKKEYQNRKNENYGNYGANPRAAYAELISDMKVFNERHLTGPSLARVKNIFEEIETLNKKSEPLIAELQEQGISEKGQDSYYNIYLKSLYRFDGQNIILNDNGQKGINHH